MAGRQYPCCTGTMTRRLRAAALRNPRDPARGHSKVPRARALGTSFSRRISAGPPQSRPYGSV